MMSPRGPWPLLKCAVGHWATDRAATIGAALAFYCAFSLAPLLIILVTITGWIVGEEVATRQLQAQLDALFGGATASVLVTAMESSQTGDGWVAAALSVGTLLVGATTVFAALEGAMQQIWGAAKLAPRGWRGFVRARVLSFGLILAVGFLLLVSLSISTALAALREYLLRARSARSAWRGGRSSPAPS
jgi:membrane protein